MMFQSLVRSLIPCLLLMTFIITFGSGCARQKNAQTQSMITVKGSDTMVHLVSAWAEQFMKHNPKIQISVTGGGSGTGIAALINGTTDIAASSRDIKPEEKQEAEKKGQQIQEVLTGQDAIAVVVNPANPIKDLSMVQLKDIFTGKITNWKEVSGPDQPILIYSRESSSGTYAFFQEHVLKKEDYAKAARLMPATSGIIEAVSSDKGGIGYVGLGYADKAGDKTKTLGVRPDASSRAVLPSEASVLSNSYPIARGLYLYLTNKAPETAKQFAEYVLSSEGQKLVQETGYIPNPVKP
jgi:phosphate transport system substrate-binding protein